MRGAVTLGCIQEAEKNREEHRNAIQAKKLEEQEQQKKRAQ
jgi:hypothetical protein